MISVYILFILMLPIGIMEEIVSKFSIGTIFAIASIVIIWINFLIFSKYLYRVVRKTIQKEPITKKEIFYLFISTIIIFFFSLSMVLGGAYV